MTVNVPRSTFRGVIKQLPMADLRPEDRSVLDLCFPEFLQEGRRMAPLKKLGINFHLTAYQPRPTGWDRLRRYAGSESFQRGRYYSVCGDKDGFDFGTLVNELMTYWSEHTMVYPGLNDSTLLSPEERAAYPELVTPKFNIYVTKYRARQTLLLGKIIVEECDEFIHELPLAVSRVEIDDVVDLRFPETQTWFFEHFVALEEQIGLRGHRDKSGTGEMATYKSFKLRDFVDLLPTLVVPGLGGSTFHQAVGAWLRSHGVTGLVYPSARCNAYWRQLSPADDRGRSSFGFSGWNFVDYRDSGPADWESLFGHLATWVLPRKAGISVKRHEGAKPGWEICGAEEAERRRVHLSRDIMLNKVAAPPGWDPRGGFRRPYYEPS